MTRRIFKSMALLSIVALIAQAVLSIAAIRIFGDEATGVLLLIVVAAVVAVIVAARYIAKAIVRPIREIHLDSREVGGHYDEITPLLHKISHQNDKIDRQTDELDKKNIELELMMENMAEGFVVLDSELNVISQNRSATHFLQEIGDFQKNDTFRRLAEAALSGKRCEDVLWHDSAAFHVMANPVRPESDSDSPVYGAALVILDVTEREMREQLRREFTSNVSHELKTPLTTIYGISDMLAAGIVKTEDYGKFVQDIRTEATRMVSLINDILKLSQLDENDNQLQREEVDLTELASSIIERLRVAAEARRVSFRLIGEHVIYSGVRSVLDEMISNLCDNAIKYNKEGGMVYVSVYRDGTHICISVEDTGIGIPQKDQSRVFERFYRVDKSHSRKIGGTGLGLSIVKHGALYHGGTVSLTSTEGEGSKIVITL